MAMHARRAGISTVLEELVQQLPASVPATAAECQAAISDAQPRLLALQVRRPWGELQQWVRLDGPSVLLRSILFNPPTSIFNHHPDLNHSI